MTKRMTLLARKEGTSTSDFRNYWAGPHAQLALGMTGITKYVHNRVDKVLWSTADQPMFDVDGVVELFFADAEAMRLAQASAVGRKYIPADEPLFLKGWTLCVVDTQGEEPAQPLVKVLIPFHASGEIHDLLWQDLNTLRKSGHRIMLNWTVSTARREQLWAEPHPPDGFIGVWFDSVAQAHEAFEPTAEIRLAIERHVRDAVAYLINDLSIR